MHKVVALIGAGRMGGPMGLNLLRAGFALRAYDAWPAALAPLTEAGAAAAESPAEAADGANVIITMLPSDAALREVMSGLLGALGPGQTLIDMGTSRLDTSRELAGLAAARGAHMLDAPVSGGEQGAKEGGLSIMVGGEREAFEAALPVLSAMGRSVTYIGGAGMGLIAKYVNQMLMEAAFCAAAEAFALAAGAGADLAAVYEAVRGGLGGSRVLDQAVPQFLSGDFGAGRELSLHHKDGGYALAAAEAVGCQAPLTALTHELFAAAMEAGQGGHSAAAVARVYEARNRQNFVGGRE